MSTSLPICKVTNENGWSQYHLMRDHIERKQVAIIGNPPEWLRVDKAFKAMEHAQFIAKTYSKDPRTKVGALILDQDWFGISWGYNGFPRGTRETPELWGDRETKYKRVRHAEANALDAPYKDMRDTSIFCTLFPCAQCAGQIIQKGLKRVFYTGEPREDLGANEAFEMFEDVGIRVFRLEA